MVKLVVGVNEVDVSRIGDPSSIKCNEDSTLKQDTLRKKMDEMQKRLDELKHKVRIEVTALQDAESTIDLSDVCHFESLYSNLSSNTDESSDDKYEGSDKSLYFSASTNSMCSYRSNSTATAYYNFTKFIDNFVQNQSPKERLSLLQLHSKKQISLNMMKHSLADLDSRCSAELEFVGKNLERLQRLATEFNVDLESRANTSTSSDNDQSKALESYTALDMESHKDNDANMHNVIFEWNNANGFFSYEQSNNDSFVY